MNPAHAIDDRAGTSGARRPGRTGAAAGHPAARIRARRRHRRGRLRHRLPRLGHQPAAPGRGQGVPAGLDGDPRRRLGRGDRGGGARPRHLPGRPEELRRRGAAARPLRPSVAGQGLPLLGGKRHRLHGDAVLRGPDPRGCARRARPCPGRGRAAGLAETGAQRRVAAARRRRLAPEHRPRQHRPDARRPGAARPRPRPSRPWPPCSTRRPRR